MPDRVGSELRRLCQGSSSLCERIWQIGVSVVSDLCQSARPVIGTAFSGMHRVILPDAIADFGDVFDY